MPKIVKKDCVYCPPPPLRRPPLPAGPRDWEMHPSWIGGMEALNAYGDWVSRYVLPVAFQWIEEHKREVYATVPEHLKDDVGVVIAAAFKLISELPSYKEEIEKSAAYEADETREAHHSTNPVWTGIVKKVRASTEEAFKEQAPLLGETEV
jgi:hypothetical protein